MRPKTSILKKKSTRNGYRHVLERKGQCDLIVQDDVAEAILKLEDEVLEKQWLLDCTNQLSEVVLNGYKEQAAELKKALRQYGDMSMWEKEIKELTCR